MSLSSERGLVISNPKVCTDHGIHIKSALLDPQELRFSLLFWDKLDWPVSSQGNSENCLDTQFLQNEGILSRTCSKGSYNSIYNMILSSHINAYLELDKIEPGKWCLARGNRSISLPDEMADEGKGLLFTLHKAIPVPDRDIPLDDVLKFKEGRKAELLWLRHEIETIYQEVIAAPDKKLSEHTNIEKLDAALLDVLESARSSGLPFRLADIRVNLGVSGAASLLASALASNVVGLDATSAVATGMAAASLGVDIGIKGRSQPGAFQYVSSIHNRLF